MKHTPLTPLPIHFKTPGRSYSQIGRKGNVALYSVYSDYFSLPDFALPYLLIGFELVVIKTNRNGVERYPRAEQFGHSAWSIPKASKRFGFTCSRMCRSYRQQLRISQLTKVPHRSATSEESSLVAPNKFVTATSADQADQTAGETAENATAAPLAQLSLGKTRMANPASRRVTLLSGAKRGGGESPRPPAGIAAPVKLVRKKFLRKWE